MRCALALLAFLLCVGPEAVRGEENPWFSAGHEAVARARQLAPTPGPAKNAIVFLGDGMGLTTVTAARIFEGQGRGEPGEENLLAFEELPYVALTKTYNTNQQTPDSAGTMTAVLTGAKTRAGVIGVDEYVARGDFAGVDGHRLPTLVERAETRGLSTGVVTTTTVTHATPAAVYAHVPERSWQDDSALNEAARAADFPDIARQLIEWPHGDGLDVVLGGGRRHFLPASSLDPEYPVVRGARRDGRDLIAEWQARHPKGHYVWNDEAFDSVSAEETHQLLGLFDPGHLHFELDRSEDAAGEPSLAELTRKAVQILSRNPRGFVLIVEGGRIDHAHHLGNAHRALADTVAFSDAVRAVLEEPGLDETLVIVTADHGHVFTLAGYPTRGNPILGTVVANDARGEPSGAATDSSGLRYTTLGYHNGPGYQGSRPDLAAVDTTSRDFQQEAAVPLRSETHSAEDVPVYAGGPGAHLIHGVQEQSYLYHAIVEALGWTHADEPIGEPPPAEPE